MIREEYLKQINQAKNPKKNLKGKIEEKKKNFKRTRQNDLKFRYWERVKGVKEKLQKYEKILNNFKIDEFQKMKKFSEKKYEKNENLLEEKLKLEKNVEGMKEIFGIFYKGDDMDIDLGLEKLKNDGFNKKIKKIYFRNLTVKEIAEESYQKIKGY